MYIVENEFVKVIITMNRSVSLKSLKKSVEVVSKEKKTIRSARTGENNDFHIKLFLFSLLSSSLSLSLSI